MSEDHTGAGSKISMETPVNNAGMILLWPFLSSFFTQLALVEHGVFVDEKARNRAVYLLQYLVDYSVKAEEAELVLNKLMCGMPHDTLLEPVAELTEREKELCQSLLKGMLGNWEKVKASSPEGIQRTFLQRSGLLNIDPTEITLTVESKGVDILLEFLPWGISTVKLPWMMQPIDVEWQSHTTQS